MDTGPLSGTAIMEEVEPVNDLENLCSYPQLDCNDTSMAAITRRYFGGDSWSFNPEVTKSYNAKQMRRKQAHQFEDQYQDNSNRNISNALNPSHGKSSDDPDYLEKLQQERALRKLESTSWWLLPFALVFRLLNLICCTYKLQFQLRGKLKKTIASPTKMLRQNVLGLFVGILIGFVMYLLFLIAFSNDPRLSTLLGAYLMLVSVFGTAFSEDFRCVALLTVPYLAASRVRWLLMLYASSVSVVGPGLNFLHNSGNFRNAIACILSQVSTNMLLIQKVTSAPFSLLKNQLQSLIDGLNATLNRFRFSLSSIAKAFFKATDVMEKQSNWITSLVEACGDETALRNQCLSFLNNIYFNCKASLGVFDFLCGFVRQFASDLCTGKSDLNKLCEEQSNVLQDQKAFDSLILLNEKVDDVMGELGQKNLTLNGDFDQFEKLTIESDDTVISLLQQHMDAFISTVEYGKYILAWILVIWTLLTMLQLIVQAAIFRKAWIMSDTFDNVYITADFMRQERRAFSQGLVPTVPLVRQETRLYKKFSSFTWTSSEKKKAFRSFIILLMWMTTLLLILFADYAMYQVLLTITPVFSNDFSTRGAKSAMSGDFVGQEDITKPPEVIGTSSYANTVRSMLKILNPIQDIALNVDAAACKPTATPPDKKTNLTVIVMLILTVLSIFFEVYILRLRHMIMIWYYPTRGIQRAAWLRTHIRNNRGLFHRLIHKFRGVDVKPGRQSANVSKLGRLISKYPFVRSALEMIGIRRIMCAFCGEEGNPSKKSKFEENFARCVECGAYFCKICQVDLDSICMLCRTPLFALSVEVDFEQFSSDEEIEAICARYLRRAEQTTVKTNPKSKGARRSRISISRKE